MCTAQCSEVRSTTAARMRSFGLRGNRLGQALGRTGFGVLTFFAVAGSSMPGQAEDVVVSRPAAAAAVGPDTGKGEPLSQALIDQFLDRLMWAESNGQAEARNPRSSAYGPYQFIESTFLYVVKRYFGEEVVALSDDDILRLRSNFAFSRRAALAYTKENAATLREQDIPPTHANLRLAFLVGPSAAVRLLKAGPEERVADLLSAQAVAANPFLVTMSVGDLLEKSARDVGDASDRTAILRRAALRGAGAAQAPPDIPVGCKLGLPSCRKWLALARKRAARVAGAGG
jgi:hypothetical protein